MMDNFVTAVLCIAVVLQNETTNEGYVRDIIYFMQIFCLLIAANLENRPSCMSFFIVEVFEGT